MAGYGEQVAHNRLLEKTRELEQIMADMATRDDIRRLESTMSGGFAQITKRLDRMNGNVDKNRDHIQQHDTQIALMEQFVQDQVKPMLAIVNENKLGLAVALAKWGSLSAGSVGGVGGVVYLIGKGQGWW